MIGHAIHFMSEMMLFFFFFQAEDGIRDIGVTGVQTCALPICGKNGSSDGHVAVGCLLGKEEWNAQPCVFHHVLLQCVAEIGRASCRGKSVDLGGRRIIKKKKNQNVRATHIYKKYKTESAQASR